MVYRSFDVPLTVRGKIRQKTARACDKCRALKRKCDGQKPCLRCVQQRLACNYNTPYRRGNVGEIEKNATLTENITMTANSPPDSPLSNEATTEEIYLGKASGITFFRKAKERLVDTRREHNTSSSLAFSDQKFHETSSGLFILPPKEVTKRLVDHYFEFCSPTYRYLHRQTVMHSLAVLYEDHERLDPAQCAIIFMCCAWSANSTSDLKGPYTGAVDSERFYQAAKSQLDRANVNSLAALQAHFMVCLYLLFSSRINQAWIMMGIIVRLAQAMGLHRRTVYRSVLENELGKRTFWSIYVLDRYLSVILGRPCALHDDDIDQELPSVLDDSELSPDARNEGVYREMFAPVAHVKLAKIMGSILKEFYGCKTHAGPQVDPSSILEELTSWKKELPDFLDGSKVSAVSLPVIFKRQQETLHLAYCHSVMLLCRQFLIPLNGSNGAYEELCVKAAYDAAIAVTSIGRKQEIATMFWFETYIGFCSVVILYLFMVLHPEHLLGYFTIAESCHQLIAQSALENVISARYAAIMDELKKEVLNRKNSAQEVQISTWAEFETFLDLPDVSDSDYFSQLFRSVLTS
jgi:hypothetical protein